MHHVGRYGREAGTEYVAMRCDALRNASSRWRAYPGSFPPLPSSPRTWSYRLDLGPSFSWMTNRKVRFFDHSHCPDLAFGRSRGPDLCTLVADGMPLHKMNRTRPSALASRWHPLSIVHSSRQRQVPKLPLLFPGSGTAERSIDRRPLFPNAPIAMSCRET